MPTSSLTLKDIDLPYTRSARLRYYWLKDHGFIRVPWRNFRKLDDDVWRHNQPSASRLLDLKREGARTILSLRGAGTMATRIEAAVCNQIGLQFHDLSMKATELPSRAMLQDLLAALRDLPKPLVIHCKSGADRTGLAAVLYLHVIKGVPLSDARAQLALRFAHNPWGRAGIVHRLLDAYADSGKTFEDWLETEYDPTTL